MKTIIVLAVTFLFGVFFFAIRIIKGNSKNHSGSSVGPLIKQVTIHQDEDTSLSDNYYYEDRIENDENYKDYFANEDEKVEL